MVQGARLADQGRRGNDGAVGRNVLRHPQQRLLLEALIDADRRKDEFLATLAHELRNPLAPMRNAVQILQLKGPATPELQWASDVMDRQVQQMVRLIDDLLDVSRISRGKLELRRERVELATVVQGAVETSRPLIEECGHELTVTLPPAAGHRGRRPDPAGPGVPEPAQQRRQVHASAGGRIGLTRRAAGQRGGRVGEGHRHRHPRRQAADRVRDVHAGGRCAGAVAGRAGHRPVAGQAAGRDARRQRSRPTATGRARAASSSSACRSSSSRPSRARRPAASDEPPADVGAAHPGRGRQPGRRRQPGDDAAR